MNSSIRVGSMLSLTAALLFNIGIAFAADTPAAAAPPSKPDREKMAQMHEKMAACLRSDKSMHDCHKEMMTQCRESMGDETCKMMGRHGMKGGHMHKDEAKEATATKP